MSTTTYIAYYCFKDRSGDRDHNLLPCNSLDEVVRYFMNICRTYNVEKKFMSGMSERILSGIHHIFCYSDYREKADIRLKFMVFEQENKFNLVDVN